MIQVVSMQINPDPAAAERNRARLRAQHQIAIQRAEANVFRRSQALANTKDHKRRQRAQIKLNTAQRKLLEVKVSGSAKTNFSRTKPPHSTVSSR